MPFSIVAAPAVERVLSKLQGVKPTGDGKWMALCPAHDDRQHSLSIKVGTDGRALMNCHASCKTAAIVAAIGLTMGDLFSDTQKPGNGNGAAAVVPAQGVATRPKMVKSYDYFDADGALAFQTCRLEPKSFRQRHPDGNGGWVWNLDGVTPVLYRLPEIIEAVAAGRRIFVVEGEKDADALSEYRLNATTSPMGAGKWRESYSDALSGADVVILPDNDEPGQAHAQQVASSLVAKGCTVRVVSLPNLPPKGDVSDWLAAGGDFDDLDALIGRTPRWSADPTQQGRRTRWRLDELLENHEVMRPPPPVVPYLAWASRSTLLAAREKSGKSTLTGYIAARVTRGLDFLDEPCQHGPVLIVGLEEFLGDTARRLRDFDADPLLIEIVEGFTKPHGERLQEFRDHITAVKPVLVILDSLMAWSMGAITDANNATQMQAVVDGLTQLCHQTGVALIVIHHAKKADGKYRDSSAIGGAVDIIAEVFCPDENADPNRRRVRPVGRVPAKPVDFRFDGAHYVRVDGEGSKPPLEQRILDVLRERPGITANDVADSIGDNRKAVLERIRFMINQRQVVNDGDSSYYRLRLPTFMPRLGLS